MKWKNSFKKGSLAAFVTLALTGSALAMPTGGTVENGSVNVDAANFGANDAIANVANGATITPQTNSIINWEAFNIAQGEALHFNTTNAALLNRVTGAQMSELLGQMTQVGGNFLYLVNPNGIHIGGTASFDVSNLTLSTLNVASEDFLKYVSGEKSHLSSQQDAAKGLKSISVDQGAHFNVANDLTLQAGKVTVADGVTFLVTAGTRKAGLNVISAETLSVKADDEGAGPEKGTMAQGNDVAFHGTVEADANRDVEVGISGSAVNLDRAKFRMLRGRLDVLAVQSAAGEYRVLANNEEAGSDTTSATAANVVQADGMEIKGNLRGTEIMGGKVELKNTTVKTSGKIVINAYNSCDSKDYEKKTAYANELREERTSKADKDNVVRLENTKLLNENSDFHNSSRVKISGGKIEMSNSELASEDGISLRALNSLHEIREKPMTQRNFVLKESNAQANSENGIQLNNTKISVNRASWDDSYQRHQYAPVYDITVLGGKVDVADDVKFRFNADNHEAELTVAAAKSYFDGNQGSYKVATEQGNDVSFHGTVESSGNYRTDMGIGGATVNLDRAKFHTPNGELSVNAVQSSEDKADGTWEDTATSANVVQADGLEIVGNRNDTEFWGGKVELKNTTIKTPGEVQVYAYKTFAVKEGSIDTEDMTAGADSVVQLTNTKILNEGSDPQSYSNVWVRGGKIEMNNSELASEDEIRLTASNSLHEVRAEGHISKELKMEANAENTVRLSNTQLHANQASWHTSSGARYTPKDSIGIYGGKVDVAKDVNFKFAAGANEANLDVAAVSNIVEKSDGNMQVSTTQGNDVAFHGTVTSDADRDAEVNIGGAAVNLDGAKFRMPKGNLSVVAIASSEDSYTEDAGVEKETALTKATAANVVQADGLDVEGNLHGTQIYGGRVELKNTTIKTPGKIEIEAYTSRDWTGKNNGQIVEKNLRAGTDNLVRLENTKLLSAAAEANGWIKWVQVYGGAVDIKDSELTSDHCVDVRALQAMNEVLLKDSPDSSHWYFPNYTTQKGEYHAGAENYLQIINSKLHANLASWNTYERPDCYVSAIGGKVSLKDVDLKSPRDIDVYAMREATGGDTVAGVIKSDTGNAADIEKMTLEAKGSARIWSGKTQMKNSSVQAGKIDLAAGVMKPLSNRSEESYPTTDLSNALFLEDVKLTSQRNTMGYSGTTNLFGGQVSLKKSEIDAESVEIDSGKMKQDEDGKFYLTKGAPLYMDSTKIKTPSYVSKSSVTNLVNGTEIKAQNAFFLAAQSFDEKIIKAYVTKDNTISLWGSTIEADFLSCKAGGINAWKESAVLSSQVIGEYPDYVTRTDGSAFTLQRDESSKIMENGIEPAAPRVTVTTAPDAPTAPLFPLTPDNAQLSEQDQENIAAGKSKAQDIIAAQTSTEAQSKALAEAVGKINNVQNASSRQKAGVVTGMIQAINEMNTLTTEEKHALQVAVLDAYGAVQEAKTEGSNRTQQANGDAVRLTTTESTAANMPTAEEPQDAVHFAG